jgi:hypothetical protein
MRKRRPGPDPLGGLDLAPLKIDIEPLNLELPDLAPLDLPAIEPLELPELPDIKLEPIEIDLEPVNLDLPELDLKLDLPDLDKLPDPLAGGLGTLGSFSRKTDKKGHGRRRPGPIIA